jgi:hypothetical protein
LREAGSTGFFAFGVPLVAAPFFSGAETGSMGKRQVLSST